MTELSFEHKTGYADVKLFLKLERSSMRQRISSSVWAVLLLLGGIVPANALEMTVHNPTEYRVSDQPVEVAAAELPEDLRESALRVRNGQGKVLESQLDDLDGDGKVDWLVFSVSLAPKQTKRIVIEKMDSARASEVVDEERAWLLWGEPNLENRWLRGHLPPASLPSEERPARFPPDTPMSFHPFGSVEILERGTGKELFQFLISSTLHTVRGDTTQYAEAGPVRGMIQRTRRLWLRDDPDRAFRVTQRYFLYKNSRRMDVDVRVTNTGNSTGEIPSNLHLLHGRMGDVLTRKLGQVEKTHRTGGHLWHNPSTGYALLYMPHRETKAGFHLSAETFIGTSFGLDYFRFAPSIGPKVRLYGQKTELEAGETDHFRCSFVFARGEKRDINKRFTRLAATASGKFDASVNGKTNREDEAKNGRNGTTNTEKTPAAPDLKWPLDGQKLTDIAVMFTASGDGAKQELQVAGDDSFETVVAEKQTERVELLRPEGEFDRGTYHWRVRGMNDAGKPGPWSETRRFKVDVTDHTGRDPVRPISPERPLFIGTKMPPGFVEGLDQWPGGTLEDIVAREKAGYNPGEEFSIPTLLKFGKGGKINLPKLEHAYRHSNNVIGFLFREYGINKKYLRPALTLGAVHGRYAGTLNIGWDLGLDSWLSKDFYDLIDRYSEYMLPVQKQTNRRFPIARYLATMGPYLSGRIGNFGTETEWGTAWAMSSWDRNAKGEIGMTTRPLNWTAPFVTGLSAGACVYRLEAVAKNRYVSAWHDGWNGYGPVWTRAMAPLLVDMVRHDLIPDRDELRKKVDVALATKRRYGVKSPSSPGTFFPNRILGALHGLPTRSVPMEHVLENQWLPDSGRHHLVPILPSYLPEKERQHFDHVIRPWELEHPRDAVSFANRFNEPSKSEAYTTLVGDTGIVLNGIEERRDPNAGPQRFQLQLTEGPVASVNGTVDWHAYAVMKQKDDSLFLHLNNHKVNYTSLSLKSRDGSRLRAEVSPAGALVSTSWDGEEGMLHVELNHRDGAVRMTVK